MGITSIKKAWANISIQKKIFALTIPMVLSNISVPLVGTVDTMIIGHLPSADNMAAVGLGSALYLFIVGSLNFLRMGTTGFTSQAKGRNDGEHIRQILLQVIILSIILAALFIGLAMPFSESAISLMQSKNSLVASENISTSPFLDGAHIFFHWRLLGLPAALLNYALIGWFLGLQNARMPLFIMLATNIMNILLSILFVIYLDRGVVGASQAAVIAEWTGVAVGFFALKSQLIAIKGKWSLSGINNWQAWKPLIFVNRDIFLRSLMLQIVFLLIAIKGGQLGGNIVAANMIIMNGLLLISYILDGFAHAIESLCGYAIGENSRRNLHDVLIVAGGWGLIVSLMFAILFLFFGNVFIHLLTDIESVRIATYHLLPYLIFLPLVSVWSYLFDGLFIGAIRAKSMRDSMFISMMIGLITGFSLTALGNDGLWIAFLVFMGLRGGVLAIMAYQIEKKEGWIA